ncbi:hypothetical protein DS832_02585 [Bombilactobacillus bombi]|uniref:CAT RNA-binding domain-containing protein n=1 Tax=Bombilactobacillus bombi TaxID=1303590 RepID=A0A417ZC48_9LACO|nr:CAT RNA binding domain-containing protein [Bombilactobacillus bombi]RHW48219.1 hypothetical protein DS832_02585 [Bombilactobacillus bombi]
MRIARVFNNNIVLAIDDNNHTEKILWGKGVGFQKKSGDQINPANQDKIFVQDTTSE